MNALSVFAFGEQMVRISDLNGEPWFVGVDVCASLGHKNHRQVLSRLPDDEKGVHNMDTLGGVQGVTIISEPGMYRLVLTSRTEKAEAFKKWVVGEVLPAIRRTGRYALPGAPANDAGIEPVDESAVFETDRGIAKVNAKLSYVRVAAKTFGPEAAQETWRRLGLIDVAPEASPNYLPEGDDSAARWLADRVEIGGSARVELIALHRDYLDWCRQTATLPRSPQYLTVRLRQMGLVLLEGTPRTVHGATLRQSGTSLHQQAVEAAGRRW